MGQSNFHKFSFFKVLGITPQVLFIIFFGILLTGVFIGLFVKNTSSFKKTSIPQIKKQQVSKNQTKKIDIKKDNLKQIESKNLPNKPLDNNVAFYKNSLIIKDVVKSPVVAIIIDDMGIDMLRSERILNLDYPFNVSYLTYAPNLQAQINHAKNSGKEVMLHIPMQAYNDNFDYGGKFLSVDLSLDENLKILDEMLSKITGIIGVNNHMGSKFTADYSLLYSVMEDVKNRGLAFIDSKTINKSKGDKVAKEIITPYIARDVFLDDSNKDEDIKKSLIKLENIAKKRGYAVAIAHPRDNTILNLKEWLPLLEKKGIKLVPVSYIIKNKNSF